MNRAHVARWLDGYVTAWRSNDRAQIEDLFTPDATYRYRPHDRPLVGAAAIADDWLKDPDDPDVWKAEYAPFAVDGDAVVALGISRYRATADRPVRTYHNCFVMRFADDGRCRDFTEWFMLEPPD